MPNGLGAALEYAARGWYVFPCKPKSKAPATEHGFKDATLDSAQIRRWWSADPNYNVGIACVASGLVVVDTDPRNSGDETLAHLEAQHGEMPLTPRALSGRGDGGTHYYYLAAQYAALPSALGPGVDVKCNGYVVAPPSVHPVSGKPYVWDAAGHPDFIPLAPLPDWIEQFLKDKRPRIKRHGAQAPTWLGLVFDAIVSEMDARRCWLRPSGNGGLTGLCPLHEDHDPSFSIHPERGWICFAGCGEGKLTSLAVILGISII